MQLLCRKHRPLRTRQNRGGAEATSRFPRRHLLRALARAACPALALILAALPAVAQKQGGVLRVYHRDSPASMSVHEEGTIGVIMPMMGVFNNLVMYDQHAPQNNPES